MSKNFFKNLPPKICISIEPYGLTVHVSAYFMRYYAVYRWHGQELEYVDSILHLELVVVESSVELNGHAETLIFDVLKLEWSVAVASPASSITTNKGFSLVLVQHKERDFLVAFGGFKKDPSNEVEVLIMEKNELPVGRRSSLSKATGNLLSENRLTSTGPASQPINGTTTSHVDSIARQNLASAVEHHGSGRKSLSESLLVDPSSVSGNVSLRKQFSNDEDACAKMTKTSGDGSPSQEHGAKQLDIGIKTSSSGGKTMAEEMSTISESGHLPTHYRQASANFFQDTDDFVFQEGDSKTGLPASSGASQQYEAKLSSLMRKNGILEGQLAAALAGREAAEKNLSSALKSKQDMEKKMADAVKEMELLKGKLASVELAQEEANSLSNIVHSDNVRLEHDVAFLKAVMDDTQKVERESGFIGLSTPCLSETTFQPTLIKFIYVHDIECRNCTQQGESLLEKGQELFSCRYDHKHKIR
ncbi:hypothetical protein CQW23_14153 [Capsicum baccatum]|uniref:Uncharacterized protein n=1 Tax=Capsicum baccatum TaxID=33114 RepID=A0A2G2WIC4_CAPBA|nr:hypothetical protein CQW23_14153 [Capsicum baccatum]